MLGEHPMIVLTAGAVARALPDADLVVAVDDIRVAEVVERAGVRSVMTSAEWESGTDRVAEVARLCNWGPDDVVLNVQGDEPLLPPDLLQAIAARSLSSEYFSMGTVCVPVESAAEVLDPNVVKVVLREDGSAITFSRAPLPYPRDGGLADNLRAYRRHLGIYAYRGQILQTLTAHKPVAIELVERLEQLRALWLGISIDVMEWPTAPPGGVDTPTDVERLKSLLSRS